MVLPLALFAQLRARQTSVAALQVIAAVASSFALAGVLALDPLSFISVATLAAMLAVLLWLHPSRPRLLQFDRPLNRPLIGLTAIAAVPWGIYALEMAANGRSELPPAAAGDRPQSGGWAGATALAVCVVLLALLASTRTPGWQVPLWAAPLATFTFGVASLVNPVAPGSAGPVWGTAALAWSAIFVITAYWSWRRASPIPDRAQHVPQLDPAARVQPGRRLVEEQHGWRRDQADREVQAPAHPTGVGLGQPVRRVAEPFGFSMIWFGITGVLGRIPLLAGAFRVGYRPQVGAASAPLLGVMFGIGWTPCIGPTRMPG